MHLINKVIIFALFAISALVLAACGGGGGGSSSSGSTSGDNSSGSGGNTGDNGSGSSIAAQASYAYITERGTAINEGRILKCTVEADGTFSNCAETGGNFPGPISISLSGGSAFIVNKPVGAVALSDHWADDNVAHSVWQCSIDASTGELSGCASIQENEVVHIDDVYVSGDMIYILQRYGDLIMRCTVAVDGSTCTGLTTVTGLSEPVNIAVSGTRMYFANSNLSSSSISLCTFNATAGTISDCSDANASTFAFSPAGDYNDVQPTGIALSDSYAFIASRHNGDVVSCKINSSGKFSDCTAYPLTGATVENLNRIAVQGNYVYVTNTAESTSAGSVIRCAVESDGALSNCSALSSLSFNSGLVDTDSYGSDIRFLYK